MKKITFLFLFVLIFTHTPLHAQRPPAYREYKPQAGDLILYRTQEDTRRILTGLATGNMITHSGIVVEDKEGKKWVMHAITKGVTIEPLESILTDPDDIFIRPLKKPLTAEQFNILSHFAKNEEGKLFEKNDLMVIAIPHIRRTPPPKSRNTYFCSQLVSTACVTANIIRSDKNGVYINPDGITPTDLFDDRRIILSDIWKRPIQLIKPPPKNSRRNNKSY